MSLFQGTELEDGRYLGLTVWEVTALSHVCLLYTSFCKAGETPLFPVR